MRFEKEGKRYIRKEEGKMIKKENKMDVEVKGDEWM